MLPRSTQKISNTNLSQIQKRDRREAQSNMQSAGARTPKRVDMLGDWEFGSKFQIPSGSSTTGCSKFKKQSGSRTTGYGTPNFDCYTVPGQPQGGAFVTPTPKSNKTQRDEVTLNKETGWEELLEENKKLLHEKAHHLSTIASMQNQIIQLQGQTLEKKLNEAAIEAQYKEAIERKYK